MNLRGRQVILLTPTFKSGDVTTRQNGFSRCKTNSNFAPQQNVYTYFRYDDEQKVMVVLNKTEEEREIDLFQFWELIDKGAKGKDVISGREFILNDKLKIGAKSALILEIQ